MLTDTAIRKAKPADKPYKLTDGGGLYLLVNAAGKYWRMKYRFDSKEKLLSLGKYPDVPLARARERRDEARQMLADGIDPGENRKAVKAARQERAANSFEAVAREWCSKRVPTWAGRYGHDVLRRFERDIFPWLGGRPVAEMSAPELLTAVRRIEARGTLETAHRALGDCGRVFRYAVATGRALRDPTGDLRGALPPVRAKHFAAIIEPKALGGLLRAVDGFQGSFVVACALRLAPLLFTRPGELRKAEWANIDLDGATWAYMATKTETEHIVPLSRQAVAILRELHALTGLGRYVFPGARTASRPMSDAAINAALRRMGFDTKAEVTGHGFRATARTLLHEQLHYPPEVIEHQLAHRVPDTLGTAYNRTKFLKERRAMMQAWADYLDKLKAGADVLQFPAKA